MIASNVHRSVRNLKLVRDVICGREGPVNTLLPVIAPAFPFAAQCPVYQERQR